jgi:hypothetical protein
MGTVLTADDAAGDAPGTKSILFAARWPGLGSPLFGGPVSIPWLSTRVAERTTGDETKEAAWPV